VAADYYELLGVARDVSPEDLKRAYRSLAKEHHPDRNPGDAQAEATFKEITKAYNVLSEPQPRSAYDRFGHEAFESGMNQGGGGSGGAGGAGFGDFSASMSDIFGDVFGNFMGGGGGGNRSRGAHHHQGESLRYDLEISLEEAATGINKEFSFSAAETCEVCSGKGAAKGSQIKTCAQCSGSGVTHQQSGFFALQRTCGACGGEGQVMTNPCHACAGQGRVNNKKTLRLKIPAGISDGAQMRLAGKGAAGYRASAAGDLYVFVHIKPHRIFDREGKDLYCSVPISITDAALGGEVQVPLLDGKSAMIKVPEGSQWGKRLRMRHKGLPGMRRDEEGDLFIDLEVEVPMNLDEHQKKLLKKFSDSLTDKNAPTKQGFLDRLQGFFEKFK
jgi:molecular chaperone DnaJ